MVKESEFNAVEYLEEKQKELIDGVWGIAQAGKPEDAVRLKAHTALLNKIVPDRTKMEVDLKTKAPYDVLKEALDAGTK